MSFVQCPVNVLRELDMSVTTTTLPHPTRAGNAGLAPRRFIAALLGAKPDRTVDAEPAGHQAVSHRSPQKSLWALYRMANLYDSVTPDLAAELRCVASRD
jgi:hypothetical protein